MEAEFITGDDITHFFNKYKYNSDQIFHLERRLLQESYDYNKWEKMLSANSELTRKLFVENEELLKTYIHPAIKNPERLTGDAVHNFLLHITFYLFENNIDSHVTDDLVLAILQKRTDLPLVDRFEALINLGISKTVTGHVEYAEAMSYLKEAEAIFPDFNAAPNDDVRIHIVFCKIFEMLCMALYKDCDLTEFIRIYDDACRMVQEGTSDLYKKMWGENADFKFHVDLLIRFFKIYGIFIAGRADFAKNDISEAQKQSAVQISEWLREEFEKETKEDCLNPMIFTFFYKCKFLNGEISKEEYFDTLSYKFEQFSEEKNFIYPETPFPVDDDPVDPHFAVLLDKIKLFNRSFSFANILIPELFVVCPNKVYCKKLANEFLRYYESSVYAEKGFQIDSFVYENVRIISSCFENISEFISFLQTIFVHREITSAIHFAMVSNLSAICLSHMLEKRPEVFVSKKYPTADDVVKNRTEIIHYCKYAGLLHDIGKLARTNLINLHFRRITDKEFHLISEHTTLGAKIIEGIDFLEQFRDVILGHHKFFDGTKGYPSFYDNLKSDYKVLVDLISICDTLDTSTDYKGRNYAEKKTFDDIMIELRTMDTRYSPLLVNLINQDEPLKEELRYMTGEGRNYTSYEMYRQFVLPNMDFSPEDERLVSLYKSEFFKEILSLYNEVKPELTENELELYINSFKKSNLYVLHTKKNNVLGIIAGVLSEDSTDGGKSFEIKDMQIGLEHRHRGLGTELLDSVVKILKKSDVSRIRINVPKSCNSEGFFWIEGFTKVQDQFMEKQI
ncbi:MAG: GNAT family N-acetyltransferase [Treponema sp.]|nr:GNAT family N-acetyltransferase [Treponema sp.]